MYSVRIDVRLTDQAVLKEIQKNPCVSQSELSHRLDCHHNTVNRAVSRLRSIGYIATKRTARCHSWEYEINYDALPESLRLAIETK